MGRVGSSAKGGGSHRFGCSSEGARTSFPSSASSGETSLARGCLAEKQRSGMRFRSAHDRSDHKGKLQQYRRQCPGKEALAGFTGLCLTSPPRVLRGQKGPTQHPR